MYSVFEHTVANGTADTARLIKYITYAPDSEYIYGQDYMSEYISARTHRHTNTHTHIYIYIYIFLLTVVVIL